MADPETPIVNPIGNPQPPRKGPQKISVKWLVGVVGLWFCLVGMARFVPSMAVMLGALIAMAASYQLLPRALDNLDVIMGKAN